MNHYTSNWHHIVVKHSSFLFSYIGTELASKYYQNQVKLCGHILATNWHQICVYFTSHRFINFISIMHIIVIKLKSIWFIGCSREHLVILMGINMQKKSVTFCRETAAANWSALNEIKIVCSTVFRMYDVTGIRSIILVYGELPLSPFLISTH